MANPFSSLRLDVKKIYVQILKEVTGVSVSNAHENITIKNKQPGTLDSQDAAPTEETVPRRWVRHQQIMISSRSSRA